jgi:hypothetical protein
MKSISRNREKFIQAMVFFAQNTNWKKLGKKKLCKLLFALDFEHFNQTGRYVTGLAYYAYEHGPYPKNEFSSISDKNAPEDVSRFLSIFPRSDYNPDAEGYYIRTKEGAKFNDKIFTPREMDIMKNLVEIWKDATGDMIEQWSRGKNKPWDIVWNKERRKFQIIDYTYAITEDSPLTKEEAALMIREEEEFEEVFTK